MSPDRSGRIACPNRVLECCIYLIKVGADGDEGAHRMSIMRPTTWMPITVIAPSYRIKCLHLKSQNGLIECGAVLGVRTAEKTDDISFSGKPYRKKESNAPRMSMLVIDTLMIGFKLESEAEVEERKCTDRRGSP